MSIKHIANKYLAMSHAGQVPYKQEVCLAAQKAACGTAITPEEEAIILDAAKTASDKMDHKIPFIVNLDLEVTCEHCKKSHKVVFSPIPVGQRLRQLDAPTHRGECPETKQRLELRIGS